VDRRHERLLTRSFDGTLVGMRVLVVEDEPKMAALLHRGLREEGIVSDLAPTAEDALWRVGEAHYDLILLDVTLPDRDGFDVCRALREREVWSPVLMLTARQAVRDRVAGLNAGADDYLAKPFSFEELLARVRALTRRVAEPRPLDIAVGELRLDPGAHRVWRGETEVFLSPLELALLAVLMRNPGRVVPRRRLLECGWEDADQQRSNVLDVAITGLRNKVDKPFGRHSVETVRGVGYRVRGEGA
jgi:two-component system OmpR family response regulator